jgi:hypothetical protein
MGASSNKQQQLMPPSSSSIVTAMYPPISSAAAAHRRRPAAMPLRRDDNNANMTAPRLRTLSVDMNDNIESTRLAMTNGPIDAAAPPLYNHVSAAAMRGGRRRTTASGSTLVNDIAALQSALSAGFDAATGVVDEDDDELDSMIYDGVDHQMNRPKQRQQHRLFNRYLGGGMSTDKSNRLLTDPAVLARLTRNVPPNQQSSNIPSSSSSSSSFQQQQQPNGFG